MIRAKSGMWTAGAAALFALFVGAATPVAASDGHMPWDDAVLPAAGQDIVERVERAWRASTPAREMVILSRRLDAHTAGLDRLQSELADADDDARAMLEEDVIRRKSQYLDDLHNWQSLRSRELSTKAQQYRRALMRAPRSKAAEPDASPFMMPLADVDLDPARMDGLADRFAVNQAQLQALAEHIERARDASMPAADPAHSDRLGQVRMALGAITVDYLILNQEIRMTRLMGRLLALDAQQLMGQIAAGSDMSVRQSVQTTALRPKAELFLAPDTPR